jgi:hypothetical protein
VPQSTKVIKLVKFSPLQLLVALYLFLELKVEGLERVDDSLDFIVCQTGRLQPRLMLDEALPFLSKTL